MANCERALGIFRIPPHRRAFEIFLKVRFLLHNSKKLTSFSTTKNLKSSKIFHLHFFLWFLFGSKGELLLDVQITGKIPELKPGENQISFIGEGPTGINSRVQVTVISEGKPIEKQ
jgi:hypothetical protein